LGKFLTDSIKFDSMSTVSETKSATKDQFERLKWLEVENFRAFRHVKIDDFADINVFIGRNNTGKSTLLEAIYLNLTKGKGDILRRKSIRFIFHRRGVYLTRTDDIDACLSYLFYNYKIRNIKFISNFGQYGFKLLFEDEISENIFKKLKKKMTFRRNFPICVIIDSEGELYLAIFEKSYAYSDRTIYRLEFLTQFLLEPIQKKFKTVFVDEYIFRERPTMLSSSLLRLERYSKINKDNLINFLTQQLEVEIQDIVPKISDIFIETVDGKYIPFSLLGDGTKVYLTYYYVLSLQNSYILLEEPENHLHPSLMNKCIELMVKSSQYNQLFITTHSLEFLQKILEMATKHNANLRVFAFRSLKDGIPEIEIYDLDEAESAVNKIGVDLR
jgi:AAA15 family ATPase/GTPase